MPFADAFKGIWQTCIKKAVAEEGDECSRADDIFAPGSVIDDVVQSIQRADYLIAELSERNPNVYYELGLAHALGKKVILITQTLDTLPFDLRHQRVIKYSDTAAGAEELRNALKLYIASLPP